MTWIDFVIFSLRPLNAPDPIAFGIAQSLILFVGISLLGDRGVRLGSIRRQIDHPAQVPEQQQSGQRQMDGAGPHDPWGGTPAGPAPQRCHGIPSGGPEVPLSTPCSQPDDPM